MSYLSMHSFRIYFNMLITRCYYHEKSVKILKR